MGGQRGERSLWRPIKLTDVVREQAICQFVSPRPSRWFLFVRRLLSSREKENTWEMDSFFRSRSKPSFGSSWSYDSLKNLRHIQPAVQNHLKLVYLTLCCALAASAVGAYLHILTNIGGVITMLGCLVSTVWLLLSTPPHEERKRFGFLMAASVLEGASVGPLIELAIDFDPRVLVTALVGTAIAFGCFSGAAIVARRAEFLYLGGLLSSGVSTLLWLQLAGSIFGHSVVMLKVELYFGLLIFLGYIVFDTQEIIERSHLGELDYVKHALDLFIDFVAVFVRILTIMLKNASAKSEDENKGKKRS
ncbi:hypothetical protein OPV22_017820 [Ensete ventricosum]|uniref:Bax inhibitor 1 n=1 Tax=Ensete ventricosum TaxID=4639 RepID=A0AAV8PFM8_ENSVE|nr:hypothetical protein OPV22_017820 [Ensete ventricosum]